MISETLTEQEVATLEYIKSRLKIDFNEGQRKILIPTAKPLMSFAVPGSGKTNTLTARVATLELVAGIPGQRILVVTFTKRATNEFRKRHKMFMERIDANLKSNVVIKTINSACHYYVSMFENSLNLQGFKIMSEGETKKLLKDIIVSIRKVRDDKVGTNEVGKILTAISWFDNRMYFERHEIVNKMEFKDLKLTWEEYSMIYQNFKHVMRSTRNLSQDEMMLQLHNLLKNNENARKEVQKDLQYICVDEFQDTTPLQYEIIKLMKSDTCGITVVGDSDQTIYRWRGATNIIYRFMNDFEDHEKSLMDINYRCPDSIIACSNALIRNNELRVPIVAKGTGKEGNIELVPCVSNKQASLEIGNRIIQEYIASGRDNYTLADKLVLYRNHSQAMILLFMLASNEVPVNVSGALLPHRDKIVQDIMAIIEMLKNPRNSELAHENLRKVTSQLKKTDKSKCPFYNSDSSTHFARVPVQVKDINMYTHDLQKLLSISQMVIENKPVVDIFQEIIPMYMNNYYMKYRIYEFMNKTVEDVDAIISFLNTSVDRSYTYSQFRLIMNQCEKFLNEQKESFVGLDIYSMHGAKGLEAETVYILDSNGRVCPNASVVSSLMESHSYAELEDYLNEERSLFYVAITRAKKNLVMTYNKNNISPFNLESGLHEGMNAVKGVITLESLGVSPIKCEEARNKLKGIATRQPLPESVPVNHVPQGSGFNVGGITIPTGSGIPVPPSPPSPTMPRNTPMPNTTMNTGSSIPAPPPPPSLGGLANAVSNSNMSKQEQELRTQEHLLKQFDKLDSLTDLAERPEGPRNTLLVGGRDE